MKDKVVQAIINLIFALALVGLGFGCYALYQQSKFIEAYNQNILDAQRSTIEQTCEQMFPCDVAEATEEK